MSAIEIIDISAGVDADQDYFQNKPDFLAAVQAQHKVMDEFMTSTKIRQLYTVVEDVPTGIKYKLYIGREISTPTQ